MIFDLPESLKNKFKKYCIENNISMRAKLIELITDTVKKK